MTYTKRVWDKLMRELNVPKRLSKRAWREIKGGYAAENRHYHTLAHIDFVLKQIDRFGAHLLMPAAVRLAAIYHDARDREEDAADLARTHLQKFGLPGQFCEAVFSLVLCTKTHRPLHGVMASDSGLLSDCDLLILAAPQKRYDAYTRKVRREWPQYNDKEFNAGRKKVMKQFQTPSPIYFTPEIREKYEARALANVKRELASL